jgi:hypothetical protein
MEASADSATSARDVTTAPIRRHEPHPGYDRAANYRHRDPIVRRRGASTGGYLLGTRGLEALSGPVHGGTRILPPLPNAEPTLSRL